ncbi:MAG: hypothetical protein GF399_11155 [Candidatus Coatesbacteria bacterium]|jgi:hypothetical protein|nr:hypothetical protein [Candidatus Coatesbacteria bacterium]
MRRLPMIALVSLVLFGGCRYTFTPNLPPGIESVAVPVFENQTFTYGIEQTLTEEVIEELLTNSPLTVRDRDRADALLLVSITRYVTRAKTYDVEEDVKERELTVEVELTFRDLASKRDLFHVPTLREKVDYYDIDVAGMEAETEEQAYERLVELLAERIVNRIIEGY